MRKKPLILLTSMAMILAACSPSGGKGGEGGGGTPSGDDLTLEQFNSLVNSKLLNVHNYSAHIRTDLEDDDELFVDFNFYNINDDAVYNDLDPYFLTGYIKQKGQGIVDFEMLKNGEAVIPGEFYATNTQLGLSEFYPASVENIFKDVIFTKDNENKLTFNSENAYAIAVIANLGLGLETMLASSPEYFSVNVSVDFSSVTISADFVLNFVDTTPGAPEDSFEQVNSHTTITLSNIGTTTNKGIEDYVKNPSTTYYAPTEWEEEIADFIKRYYNNELPPFLTGMSYAYDLKEAVSGGDYCASIIDYASGDLTSSYGEDLVRDGYSKVSNTEFVKKVTEVEDVSEREYRVIMLYHSPTEKMYSGEPYGFCYPNGVFQVKYITVLKSLQVVNTVGKLKQYLTSIGLNDLLDLSSLDESIEITGFQDGTDNANKSTAGTPYQFVAPSTGSGGFKVKIKNYEDALKFANAQKAIYNKFVGTGSQKLTLQETAAFGSWYSTDDGSTAIKITYVEGQTESSYPGSVQIGLVITKAFYEANFGEPIEKGALQSISLSGYKTEYTVGDAFSFNGTCTAHYENGEEVVTPTSVSTPDMSTTGTKEVVVTYTENDVTVRATYNITVSEKEEDTYSITVRNVAGATITVSTPASLKAKEGSNVIFKVSVEEGYNLESINVVAASGLAITVTGPNLFTQAYSFVMPGDNVTISVTLSGGEEETFGITYFVFGEDNNFYNLETSISNTSELVTSAKEGDTVALNAIGNEGFTIVGYKVNETEIESATGSFTMPGQNTLIYIYVIKE